MTGREIYQMPVEAVKWLNYTAYYMDSKNLLEKQ